jgi:hypothetical protein
MADTENIEREFRRKVCDQLEIVPEGLDRYLIVTPLAFDDGDLLPIVLKREGNRWSLSDEGHTFLQLSYKLDDVDLHHGTRGEIISKTLSSFQMENRKGELILPIPDERFGDSLYSFVQALLKIDDVRYLTRERVRSTFFEDFRALMENLVPPEHRTFDWREPQRDPDGKYQVDCRINGRKAPLFVFALPTDERVQIATISLLTFEKWNLPHRSLGIFEEQEKINPKTLARFADVCEKTFSNLSVTGDRFPRYFSELTTSAA